MPILFNPVCAGSLPRPKEQGFTLVEVMIASVVFMLAAGAALAAIGGIQASMNNSNRRHDALIIAHTVASNLRGSGTHVSDPLGINSAFDLLGDADLGAPSEANLNCFGADSVGTGTCPPDYPRAAPPAPAVNDLARVLEQSVTGAIASPVFRITTDASGGQVVNYKGFLYRVVWNVEYGLGVASAKKVQVLVGWEPFATAIRDGRVERVFFEKGDGI